MIVIAFLAFAFGVAFGKWATDKRWTNSRHLAPFRISCGGKLYEVRDVTPKGWR